MDSSRNGNDVRRILGVDPGLNITGYGLIASTSTGIELCEAGVIRGRARGEIAQRVQVIHDGIVEVIKGLQPDIMALEELYSHCQHPRTAILMGHARGVICLAAAQNGVPIKHYSATQIKKIITGSGRAPKLQMQMATVRELSLSKIPEPPDVADALSIALCHYFLNSNR